MNHVEMLLEGKEAVIFDVDGTLIDSMGVWQEVDAIYLARHGREVPPDISRALAGLSIRQAADYFREVIGIHDSPEQMLAEWNALAYEQYRYKIRMKAGADRWLQLIADRGLPMAVGTSNSRLLAMTALKTHHMEPYFKVVLTGEDVVKGKPDPYIYLTAASRLGVAPEHCLIFEDIPEGIQAGRAAGMKVCAVWDRFSAYQTEAKKALAHYYIDSFEDIFENKVEVLA